MKKWNTTISKKYFFKLYSLVEHQDWLLDKDEAFKDLWKECDNDDKKDLIIDLLNRFFFLRPKKREEIECIIFNELKDKFDLTKSVFLPLADQSRQDGSVWESYNFRQHFLQELSSTFYNDIKGCQQCKSDSDIILIDDFIGSGDKIIKKIKYLNTLVQKNIIACVCPVGMKEGVERLREEYPSITFIVPKLLKKGITDYDRNADYRKQIIKMLSEGIGIKEIEKFLGYNNSEALFSYEKYKNIPNNVFPLFWSRNKKGIKRLFMRKK